MIRIPESSKANWLHGRRSLLCSLVMTFIIATPSIAQEDLSAGILPFSTHIAGQYDSIDLASSNITVVIPILQKNGKLPFSYQLVGNFHVFSVATGFPGYYMWGVSAGMPTPPAGPGGGLIGTPVAGDLGTGQSGSTGPGDLGVWTNASVSYIECTLSGGGTGYGEVFSNFYVIDAVGTWHPFSRLTVQINRSTPGCGAIVNGSTIADDGSGYQLAIALNPQGTSYSLTLYDRSGNEQLPNVMTDPDGVQASFTKNATTGVTAYTDTLGQLALTSSPGSVRFRNGISDVYTYYDVNGNAQTAKVKYTQYFQRTNFGCGATETEFNSPGLGYFPTSVVLADGETYGISYEATPGYPGEITGRIATITLPNNGYIAYAYLGGNNGVICGSDGVVPTLTRTINDNNGHNSTWKYVSIINYAYSTGTATTVVETDPIGNTTTYQLRWGIQTEKVVNDVTLGTLSTTITCYNGNNSSQSACLSPTVTLSNSTIYQTDAYTTLGTSSTPSLVETVYDHEGYWSLGNVLSVKTFGFGATYPPSGTPLSETDTTYANINGVACGSLFSYIADHPCTVTTYANGALVGETKYTYNAGGHPIQTLHWIGNSTYLTSSASYNSNGTIATSTGPNGTVTSYYYNGAGGCSNLFPTSSESAGLTTAETWTCYGGLVTSVTDSNGAPTQYGFIDQNGIPDPLWRLRSITDGLNNVTRITFSAAGIVPATVETSLAFNASTVDTLTTLDGLGRPVLQQTRQAPGSLNFDTVSIAYDLDGRRSSDGEPCVSTASVACSSFQTATTYDALDRTASVTDGGGGYTRYTYNSNDVLSALGPAPSGENVKQSQTQYDGMGRPTSVCNISTTVSGAVACNQSSGSYSGIITSTVYNGETVYSTRGVQTRTTTVDGLGRVTVKATPEAGTWYYYYDTPNCNYSSASPGNMTCSVDPNGITTLYFYDALNRLTDVNAVTAYCRRYRYDSSGGVTGTRPTGITPTNPNGRLVEAETDNCTLPITPITDEWFGYDANGRMTDVWELTPHSGGYYHSTASYYANGQLSSLGVPGLGTVTYGLDGEGRLYSAALGSLNLVSGVTYNGPLGPSKINIGSGSDNDSYSYSSTTGRMNTFQFNVGSTSLTGTLNWNTNGTLGSLVVADGFSAMNSQTCAYSYDDLTRLVGDNCNPKWAQTFTYDQYDNLNQYGSAYSTSGYNPANNHYTLAGTSYDADGNLTSDSMNNYTYDGYNKLATATPIGAPPCATSSLPSCITSDAFGNAVELQGNGYYEMLYGPTGKLAGMIGSVVNYAYIPLPGGGFSDGWVGTEHYTHLDWLRTARLATTIPASGSGTLFYDRSFAPYGQMYGDNGPAGSSVGQTFAGDTGDLYWNLFDTPNREYSQLQGRWLTPDPAQGGWNLYAYPANPNSQTDPTGLWCVWEDGTHDPDERDGGDGMGNCLKQGGHWDTFDTINGIFQDGNGNITRIDYIGGKSCTTSDCGAGLTLEQFDQTLQSYSVVPSENNGVTWAWDFTKSFFGRMTIDTRPGSCIGVAVDSYKPVVDTFKKSQDYAKNYVAPIVASLPGAGASVSNLIYSTVPYGADRGNALEIGGAVSAAAAFVARQGQIAVSGITNAAKNPVILLGAADLALAWGVGNEVLAAYQGKCH